MCARHKKPRHCKCRFRGKASGRRVWAVEIMNQVRGYAYLFGVLKNQQADPFCRSRNSFVKTLAAVREDLATFEARHAGEIRNLRISDPPRFIILTWRICPSCFLLYFS